MNIIADLHTHTCVSAHAHSTIIENCTVANKIGLFAIATTDHGPAINDGTHFWRFSTFERYIPRIVEGVFHIRGAEANIIDMDANLDIDDSILDTLDFVIGSFHKGSCLVRGYDNITSILEKALKNPRINVFGHLGSPIFAFDHEKIISQCNKYNKAVEINNSSFFAREGSKENCLDIAKLCRKYEVPVIVNSDAHFAYGVGNFERSLEVLKKADFPEELVVNSSIENLRSYFLNIKGMDINVEMNNKKNCRPY